MTTVNMVIAQQQLAELLTEAEQGHEVIIRREDGTSFQLVLLSGGVPVFGSAAGLIQISDDFDAPLDEFEAYYQ